MKSKEAPEKPGADIWYLYNSGFAVRTASHMFIFDYFDKRPLGHIGGLDVGMIDPAELRDLNVVVFVSHAHRDHFSPSILRWKWVVPKIRYVLSFDITVKGGPNVTIVYPNMAYDLGDVKVRTLKSTDEGVAFLIKSDGMTIYHAGDLNWWHWEGEPDKDNQDMADAYKHQISLIQGEHVDLAFIPLDPRLGRQYLWGFDHFMRSTETEMAFPMHFREDLFIQKKISADPAAIEYRDKIVKISRRGERFRYPGPKREKEMQAGGEF